MIFYFSGTGNSQFVAIQLAKALDEELVSIGRGLRSGRMQTYHSEQPLVFVAPTYAWRMPRVVEQWIRQTTFQGNPDAYFVLTCGDDCGNAAAYAQRLCRQVGLRFCGLAPVVMPENYLALFPTPNEAECQAIVKRARPTLAALATSIQNSAPFPPTTVSFAGRFQSGPVNPLFYTFCVHDRAFTVSDACTACGACARRCPLHNIELVQAKPVWKGDCTHCMACIGGCPTKAIQYKTKTKGRHRHYIMVESLPCEREGQTP